MSKKAATEYQPRYQAFLDFVGPSKERQQLYKFQIWISQNRTAFLRFYGMDRLRTEEDHELFTQYLQQLAINRNGGGNHDQTKRISV